MRKYIAEFIAVFFLVFVGAGSIVADTYLESIRAVSSFGVLGVALAHGLALAMAIAAVGHISGGHVNPAISIAMWVSKRLSLKDLGGYIVAQLAGAAAAAGALKLVAPAQIYTTFTSIGVPGLAEGVNIFNGIAFEAILTFFLAFVVWGVAVDRRGPASIGALAIGLTVTFDILAGGAFVGAAMNPARWFGPAAVAGNFANGLVWIVGPVLGALLASLIYETFLLSDEDVAVTVAVDMEEDLLEEDVPPPFTRAAEPTPPEPEAAHSTRPTEPEAGFGDRESTVPAPPSAPPSAPPPPPSAPPATESSRWTEPPERPSPEPPRSEPPRYEPREEPPRDEPPRYEPRESDRTEEDEPRRE